MSLSAVGVDDVCCCFCGGVGDGGSCAPEPDGLPFPAARSGECRLVWRIMGIDFLALSKLDPCESLAETSSPERLPRLCGLPFTALSKRVRSGSAEESAMVSASCGACCADKENLDVDERLESPSGHPRCGTSTDPRCSSSLEKDPRPERSGVFRRRVKSLIGIAARM